MYGIKETKEVLDFVRALIEAFKSAMSDGAITVEDLPVLFALYAPAQRAFDKIEQVPKELMDLDVDELDELKTEYGDLIAHPAFKNFWNGALEILKGVSVIIEDIDGTE